MPLEQQSIETPEAKPLRAIHAEFHGSDTQIDILQMLTARGFTIHGTSVAKTKDKNIYRATIVLQDADGRQFVQAINQITKIVTVMRAAEINIEDVNQHIQVRISSLSQEQRDRIRKLGGHVDENIFWERIKERDARAAMRNVSDTIKSTGTKIVGTERTILEGKSGHKGTVATLRIRVRDMSANAREQIQALGVTVGGPMKIHYRANPKRIDAFQELLTSLEVDAEEILIDAPSVSSTTLLKKSSE